jgi:hypothetical protein
MRDDFDAMVADRFKVLDDVPVPDTWSRVLDRVPVGDTRSRVPFSDEALTMINLETPVPTEPRRKGGKRVLVAGLLAAAAVAAIALVVTRDDDAVPADRPAPAVTVPPTTPPRALFATPDGEQLAPGTYFVDEVDGTPTARIFVTIGAGWSNFIDEGIDKGGPTPRTYSPEDEDAVGFISFSRPDQVYLDACHLSDGFHPGPVTTLDGLVTALSEQGGWADVTAPSDISIDGYPGKTFQRTAPAVISDCPNMSPGHMRLPELGGDGLKSWQNEDGSNFGGSYYEPGQLETLLVLDIDGTVIVINANLWAGTSAADRAEFADVLDSIRIARPLPNVHDETPLEPGTYYVDEVNGTPTPRIFATLDSGWRDVEFGDGWLIAKGGFPDEGGIGLMTITNPVAVFSDACHPTDGFYPGSVATVDGFVTALREQQGGWADVTEPSDISVDGYVGKAFQRTAPADMSGCTTRDGGSRFSGDAVLPSWESSDGINMGYAPGQIETLWVLDIDGTVVVISTELWPGPSATAHADFADAVLDSIRIHRP